MGGHAAKFQGAYVRQLVKQYGERPAIEAVSKIRQFQYRLAFIPCLARMADTWKQLGTDELLAGE